MRSIVGVFATMLFVACASREATESGAPNRWSDEALLSVLDAQEHRDVDRLCALLKDPTPAVREAAALAFASVQDSTSIPCLLAALGDDSTRVRKVAVFSLGFVADSLALEAMAQQAMNEPDPGVQQAYFSSSFIAMQRTGRLKDANAILYFLESSKGQDRVRAADALRRMPDSIVMKMGPELGRLFGNEGPEVRPFLILAMKKLGASADHALLRRLVGTGTEMERINALRVLHALDPASTHDRLLELVGDPVTGPLVLELLATMEAVDGSTCLDQARIVADTATRIVLLGLAMEHGDEQVRESAREELSAITTAIRSPYLMAAVITARAHEQGGGKLDEMLAIMQSDLSAVERQAALQGAITIVRNIMVRSRYASPEARYTELGHVLRAALNTGDAGLVSAAAEELNNEDAEALRIMLDDATVSQARAALLPIRDLEALQLLDQVTAKRDGRSAPAHKRPPFNHPIDPGRLNALPQGQRYRITTTKGEIIIATDVNECPGSSLAFDSLVTAGYYNGKAFHRVVPNFVVQGGCPRGDGYGGMPWTLRTEIGRTPFTAGSVGLASAGPDTESCQFFITHSATPHLDGRYTRFGEVVTGMDVVWRIRVGDVMERVEKLP